MAVTAEQREAFAARLRQLITSTGVTLHGVADALADHGEVFSHQAVSAWQRGEYAPQSAETVQALEQIFGVDGELLDLLGMAAGPNLTQRVEDLERRVAALEAATTGPSRPRRR